MYLKQTTSKFICKGCQEPGEFNLFFHLKWNQRKSVKTNGLFSSKVKLVDVSLNGLNYKLCLVKLNNLLKSH